MRFWAVFVYVLVFIIAKELKWSEATDEFMLLNCIFCACLMILGGIDSIERELKSK